VTQDDKSCWVLDGGLIPYAEAFALQRLLVEARKVDAIPDLLLMCEHPHVITLGRNGITGNLLASNRVLKQMNVDFQPTDRGGDITYHGPGQLIGYPILDLTAHRRDVRWYVNQLEEVMIRATADFGISAKRIEGCRGVWVETPSGEEKLAALGVHLSRWVTSHGFAYNVSTDLRYFDLIVPCGIAGKRATSLERLFGHPAFEVSNPAFWCKHFAAVAAIKNAPGPTPRKTVTIEEARSRLTAHFGNVFGRNLVTVSRELLEETLAARSIPGAFTNGHNEFSPDAEKAVAAARELAEY
jgi:lipoyl(octanoyl) transferase